MISTLHRPPHEGSCSRCCTDNRSCISVAEGESQHVQAGRTPAARMTSWAGKAALAADALAANASQAALYRCLQKALTQQGTTMSPTQQGEESVQSSASTLSRLQCKVSAGGTLPRNEDKGWAGVAGRRGTLGIAWCVHIIPEVMQRTPGHSNQQSLLSKGSGELPGGCHCALLWFLLRWTSWWYAAAL